jgi:hypothetical protein
MPRAKVECGREDGHPGKCRTPESAARRRDRHAQQYADPDFRQRMRARIEAFDNAHPAQRYLRGLRGYRKASRVDT